MIPIYKPYYPDDTNVRCAIADKCFSQGKYVDEATRRLSEITGSKYVLLTNNGLAALHLCVLSLRKFHPKVNLMIVPNNVYPGAWNVLLFESNNWGFRVVDANINTWNADYNTLPNHMNTPQDSIFNSDKVAFLIVHNLGNISNVPHLKRNYPEAVFIEDNCEGFTGMYEEHHAGTQSFCSATSFHAAKNITCGEGGAFFTNEEDVYDYALKYHWHGQSETKFIHDTIGRNYRLTDIQAAMLCDQLQVVDKIDMMKGVLFNHYRHAFKHRSDIRCQESSYRTTHGKWMFGVRVIGSPGYDIVEEFMQQGGIETRPMFYPITSHLHLKPIYGDRADIAVAEVLSKEVFLIPSYPDISLQDRDMVVRRVLRYADEVGGGNEKD